VLGQSNGMMMVPASRTDVVIEQRIGHFELERIIKTHALRTIFK